tara:strand:- start:1047 stop:1343 length:297 start_codon:yes stop_codon:yes gene_type:complete
MFANGLVYEFLNYGIMKTNWININERLPEELKNVLVTINYDDELHLAYLKDGKWKIWIDDELVLNGDAWIDNTLDQKGFGVIAWIELPKRADWQEVVI